VRRELQNLPETLDTIYAQVLRRIYPNQLSTTKRLLQFLTYSERPLTLEEAVDLIAVDLSGQPAFTPDNRMPVPEEIIQYCSSLVALTHKGKRAEIQLAHFSVKEYLLSDRLEPLKNLVKYLQRLALLTFASPICFLYTSHARHKKQKKSIIWQNSLRDIG
jgi:MoxR-like ATPase